MNKNIEETQLQEKKNNKIKQTELKYYSKNRIILFDNLVIIKITIIEFTLIIIIIILLCVAMFLIGYNICIQTHVNNINQAQVIEKSNYLLKLQKLLNK